MLLFHPSSGYTAICYLSGPTLIGAAWGPTVLSGWVLVATADFNGDGKPDYVLYNGSTRQTAIWYLNNNVYVWLCVRPNSSRWLELGRALRCPEFHRLLPLSNRPIEPMALMMWGIPSVVVIAAARPNQMMKRYNRSELATTPCRGLSLSR